MSLEVQIARIDENVKHIKASLPPISNKLDDHAEEIANIKRDRKWLIALMAVFFGALGTMAHVLAEFMHP